MKYKFLIYISYSYAVPIGIPLEKEILKRGEEVFWFSDLPEGRKAIEEAGRTNLLNIEEAVAYEPHIVLTATDDVADFLSGIKVQVFHGFFSQKRPEHNTFAHFRIRGFFDLYCTQGPSTTEVFKQLAKKYKYFEVKETGWSKVDGLFPVTNEVEHKERPQIMIASTFTERLSLAYYQDVFLKIQELSATGRYDFAMVLHPKLPEHIKEKWKSLDGEYFNYYNTTNLVPIIQKSDLLFSDTTSVIQEFMLQKKPVVTFKHTFQHDYLIHVDQASKIEEAISYGLSRPKKIMEKLATFIDNLHPYHDGKSSERIMDASIEFLNKDKSGLKRKPLNFIRKIKIRNRLNYFTLKSYRKAPSFTKPTHLEKITAIIPVGNEIHNIEEVIASVNFADEILVVDSFSTDGTYEKAKSLATRVIQREYGYSASQKNWAIPQAAHGWIILVDADERVTVPLKHEILSVLANPPKDDTVGYWIGRKNHFMGEHVKYSGWKNDKVIRLFKRDFCKYEDKNVHEEIIPNGKVGRLKSKFYHDTYISLDLYLEKMNKYAWWQAKDYDKKTGKLTAFHFILKPLYSFTKHYFIQGGFRDGVVGITISYIQGYTVFMRYAKLWLLRRNRR
ncbi:MAG: glycosyltransferase [Mesonia sp.]|uniref:glycosyltransferase n=1 Tax=Mesonia sp. TaxID=1960830 RepID=UPI003F95D953